MNNRIIIITALFSLFGCSMNGQNAISEEDTIIAFSFGKGGGMNRFGGFDYDITETSDHRVHFLFDQRRPEEKEFTIDDHSVFDSLQQVIMKRKMYRYSGNYQPRTQVYDGESWHFNVLYASGKSISASGYMAGPDGYYEDFRELHSCLAKWKDMPATPNEVVSFIYHYGADTYSITRDNDHAVLTLDNETTGLHQRLEKDLKVLEDLRILFITNDLKMDSEKEEVRDGCTPWDYEINYTNGEHYQYFSYDCGYKCGYTEHIQGFLSCWFTKIMPQIKVKSMNNNTFTISGQIVDLIASRIFSGTVNVENGKIVSIKECETDEKQFIMPGFVDAHIHIESSMVVPSEFARMATPHGTVATVSDPHEIANVLGIEGIKFMIESGKRVPFKFFFGAPSCVPSTCFETAGFTLDSSAIEQLMAMDDIHYLSEMMNCPGVLFEDPDILKKLAAARNAGKPIDGHAPALSGDGLKKYVAAGISTDHECFTLAEAEEKIGEGMLIQIREGSAAKNFEALIPLMATHPDKLMFCSDDKHPNDLLKGHVNELVKRAIDLGYNILDVLKAASVNTINHYHLNVGLLQKGDDADFIVVDNLNDLNVKQTYIKGECVAENGVSSIAHLKSETPNNFVIGPISKEDIALADEGKNIKVIGCFDGQLITDVTIAKPKVENGNIVSDVERDMLKMVVVNRYAEAKPAVAFIRNFGLKQGAIASSVAHDSHNIVAVGASDEEIVAAVNKLIENKGGVVAYSREESAVLPLPVAGLMSADEGEKVAENYEKADALAHRLGTTLYAPFMTLAFMSLVVIPDLKLSDKGLFDVKQFGFTSLFE